MKETKEALSDHYVHKSFRSEMLYRPLLSKLCKSMHLRNVRAICTSIKWHRKILHGRPASRWYTEHYSKSRCRLFCRSSTPLDVFGSTRHEVRETWRPIEYGEVFIVSCCCPC